MRKLFFGVVAATSIAWSPLSFSGEISVMDVLEQQPDYSTFVRYLKVSGLDESLELPLAWKWTIFAPTNGAFENLNGDMRKGFEGDKQLLKNLLIDHLLVGDIQSGSLEGNNKTLSLTVSQKPIQLYRDQDMYVKDMVVKDKDMSADNGIIHGIDCVMFVQQSETDDRLTADIQDAYPVTTFFSNYIYIYERSIITISSIRISRYLFNW